MHKYFIEIYKYTSDGALETLPFTTKYADNEIQLRAIRDQYAYEYQTRVDEETGETVTTANKVYKVRAYKFTYKVLADMDKEIASYFDLTV